MTNRALLVVVFAAAFGCKKERARNATKRIEQARVRAVAEEAVKACFYSLKDDYTIPITDNASARITQRRMRSTSSPRTSTTPPM